MTLMPLFWSHHESSWSQPWARLPAVEIQTKYTLPIVHTKLPMVKFSGPRICGTTCLKLPIK